MWWELLCSQAKVPRVVFSLFHCSCIIALPKPKVLHLPLPLFLTRCEHMRFCTLGRKGKTETAKCRMQFFLLKQGRFLSELTTLFQFHFLTDWLAVHSRVGEPAVATSEGTCLSEAGECILLGDAERTWSAEVAVSSEPALRVLGLVPQRHKDAQETRILLLLPMLVFLLCHVKSVPVYRKGGRQACL